MVNDVGFPTTTPLFRTIDYSLSNRLAAVPLRASKSSVAAVDGTLREDRCPFRQNHLPQKSEFRNSMMARTLTAHLRDKDVPARKALQHAIDELKFPLALDDAYVPFETSGYLPCTLNGEDAGFDLRFQTAAASETRIADRDTVMSFKWAGDPREEASALMVCAALVKEFDALVQGDGNAPLSFDALFAKVKAFELE
jgi:hypothetical protein